LINLLNGVFNTQVEDYGIDKMFRLGRWYQNKARTLLVSLKDLAHKETIRLSNLANVKAPIEKLRSFWLYF